MNIFRISCRLSNAYLVKTPSGSVLIDTGAPGSENIILKAIKEYNFKLSLIFITHAHMDHFGSAAKIKQATNAPIVIHQSDSQMLTEGKTILGSCRGAGKVIQIFLPLIENILKTEPVTPDWIVEDRDSLDFLGIDAICVHAPGHTPGSSALILEDGSVFVGDLISSTGKPHLQRYFAQDWLQIEKSIRKLQDFNPSWLYPGHGSQPVPGKWLDSLK
jgi:glyoxylase-like metal-dependent hydrolase (beta-lactamase superfamily II)